MKRKDKRSGPKNDDSSSGGGWEIVYSGFILIMLCFFIMLCSFSTMEEAKIMRFVRSFTNAVSFFPGGMRFKSGGVVLPESPGMVASESELAKLFENLEMLSDKFNLKDKILITFEFNPM